MITSSEVRRLVEKIQSKVVLVHQTQDGRSAVVLYQDAKQFYAMFGKRVVTQL